MGRSIISQSDEDFESLNTYLYRQIKDMIWKKKLIPGEKIIQEHLAGELGVSRTPLIKVLERLTSERLVEYIPRRGYFIKTLTLVEMMEIFSIREILEGVAAKEVAEKANNEEIKELKSYFTLFGGKWNTEMKREYLIADQDFHTKLIEIAGNELLKDINEMFNIYRFSFQRGLMRDPVETLPEHLAILEKISNRDLKNAQSLMMEHIEKSRNNIQKVYADRVNEDGTIKW